MCGLAHLCNRQFVPMLSRSFAAKDKSRKWPMSPDEFDKVIRTKHVMSGADVDEVLIPKYRKTFDSVFRSKHNDEMVFADLDFSAQHCWNLLDLLRTNSDSIRVLDSNWDFH